MLNNFEENKNYMSSTNCILTYLDILLELFKVVVLNCNHSLTIKFFNALPDLSIFIFMVLKLEPGAPMTEITRENE